MALQATEIGKVRQIARLNSFAMTESLVNRLNEVEELQIKGYLTEWATVERKFTVIKGDSVDIDKSRYRLALINDVRRLLGLSELLSETDSGYTGEVCFSNPTLESDC